MAEITYQKITWQDRKEVAGLYEKYLNAGPDILKYIEQGMQDQNYIGWKACDEEGTIAGFISGRDGIDFTYPHEAVYKELDERFGNENIYTTDAFLIREEYRHLGIADMLGVRFIEEMHTIHKRLTLHELWIHPDGYIPAKDVLLSWGNFVYEKEFPDFYKDLDQYHMDCPICGKHCRCGALIKLVDTDKNTLTKE